MMSRFFLIGCFSLFASSIFAQQYLIDTIQQELLKENTPVQEIDLHIGLIRAYGFMGSKEEREHHLAIVKELSEAHQYIPGIVAGLLFSGVYEHDFGNPIEAQLSNYTKALQIARTHQDKGSEAFAAYHLAEIYVYDKKNFKKGEAILLEALEKIDASVPDKHIGNIYKTLGVLYLDLGKDSLAMLNYDKALSHFKRVATHPFIVPELGRADAMSWDDGLMNKGQILFYQAQLHQKNGALPTALAAIDKSIAIYTEGQAPDNIAYCLEIQASIYFDMGNYEAAISGLQKAAIIYEEEQSLSYSLVVYDALGSIFFEVADFDAAKKTFEKGLGIAKSLKDTAFLINFGEKLGLALQEQGQLAEATQHALAALQLAKLFNQFPLNNIYNALGHIYAAKDESSQAIAYFRQAFAVTKKLNRPDLLLKHSMDLAKGFSDNQQTDSAQHYIEAALLLAETNPNPRLSESLTKIASGIYEKAGKYQLALNHHKKYVTSLKASNTQNAQKLLKNEQVRQDVVGIEAQRKQAELEADLLASRNQLYIALAGGLGLILLLGSYLFYQLRKTKAQLETQNLQLQQLNATKDKFFGIIAHDIRSPMVALDGVGEQMDYYLEKNKPEKLKRLAGRIDGTAKRLSSLLDNLLNWALLQQGVVPYYPKMLNVKELSDNVLTMFKENAAMKNIRLVADIATDLKVHADESAMQTILRNLVSNAIKFTPSGGAVTLSTKTEGDKVFIYVNDTGTGIAAEKLPKLFSLDKQSVDGTAGERGTGLGLTLVKELAELNKGTIRVMSVLGKGSEFIVGLPVAA